jgi:hypothetical protein
MFVGSQDCLELHAAVLTEAAARAVADVAQVDVGHVRRKDADVRVYVALAGLVCVLVEVADGRLILTAGYGSHFFAVEGLGNSEVFDGQHDKSPKGWVWVGKLINA